MFEGGEGGDTHRCDGIKNKVIRQVERRHDRGGVEIEDEIVVEDVVDGWEKGRDGD